MYRLIMRSVPDLVCTMTKKSSAIINRPKDSGFTLVEMAIVMLIVGFMSTIFYTLLFHSIKLKPSEDRIEIIKQALAEHVRIAGRFPCPADPTLAEGDANYMSADCAAAVSIGGTILSGALPINELMIASDCGANVAGDAAYDAFVATLTDNQAETFSGQLLELREKTTKKEIDEGAGTDRRKENRQVKDRSCITPEFFLDQHGSKITYMVTTRATRIHDQDGVAGFDPFDNTWGQITILNAVDQDATANPAIFAIISHGDNRQGAYNTQGLRAIACAATAGNDNENCDDDNELRDQLHNDNLAGGNYYDDVIDFSLSGVMLEEDYWRWEEGAGSADMVFNNNAKMILNNVPAGVPAEVMDGDEKLIVNEGNVEATGNVGGDEDIYATGEVNANQTFSARRYCYETGIMGDCLIAP